MKQNQELITKGHVPLSAAYFKTAKKSCLTLENIEILQQSFQVLFSRKSNRRPSCLRHLGQPRARDSIGPALIDCRRARRAILSSDAFRSQHNRIVVLSTVPRLNSASSPYCMSATVVLDVVFAGSREIRG